jgi:hypothetical protein
VLGRRTLVTLGVIVLQADLEPFCDGQRHSLKNCRQFEHLLDGLQKVALLRVVAVVEELSDILTHTGCKSSQLTPWMSYMTAENRTDGDLGHFAVFL